ncbi:heavy metal sensor histidine kinase [Moritella sp.]|uniref:heavy metal sensor histidine kinase n=1 Tax=Moritella sp. TaxID=78556 RepID=UPI001DC43EA6|nr:heavy metal sensor histidine kinase [Moritella sp.]MCJ8348577.1 heavy metal sensor histidine kinase [Moritella sp.]NQZ39090.1 heavy metal sensor histidine kinase [Moritella sp.]
MRGSIATKLTLHFTLSYFLIVSAAIAFFWWFSSQHFNDMDKQYILSKSDMVIAAIDGINQDQDINFSTILTDHPDTHVLAINNANQLMPSSYQGLTIPSALRDGRPGQLVNWQSELTYFKGIATITRNRQGENFRLIVIRDVTYHAVFLNNSTQNMILSMGLMFCILSIIGAFVAWYGLSPLRKFSMETSRIDINTLATRLDPQEYPKEMQSSIQVFNLMLKRLEGSFDQLSFYAANLAHQLRTPLASMTVRNQCMLQGERSSLDYKDTLESNIEELEFLSKTVTDILLMAKAESEQLAVNNERVDVYELASKLADYFQLLADEKNVNIIIEGQAELSTDSALLRRIIANLLSNAVRHADDNSKIIITIEEDNDNIQLSVSNAGKTIPTDDCTHLFERNFTHNNNSTVNIGIGLTLSRALLNTLGGRIWVKSARQSTQFYIRLPKTNDMKVA